MKKWVLISDLIFAFSAAAIPSLCVLRYFRVSLLPAVLLGVGIGSAVAFAVFLLKRKRHARILFKRADERQKRALMIHLALLPPEVCFSYLLGNDNRFYLKTKQGISYLETTDALLFPLFLLSPVELNQALPFLRIRLLHNRQKAYLLCDEINPAAAAFLMQFDVECVTGDTLYKHLKEQEKLPAEYVSEPYFTKKKKRLPRIWFSKTNSRRFFTCAILLLFSSLLVPFPYYYLIFGCLLTVAAVLIRVFGYR